MAKNEIHICITALKELHIKWLPAYTEVFWNNGPSFWQALKTFLVVNVKANKPINIEINVHTVAIQKQIELNQCASCVESKRRLGQ